jgi:hypothetical protein
MMGQRKEIKEGGGEGGRERWRRKGSKRIRKRIFSALHPLK